MGSEWGQTPITCACTVGLFLVSSAAGAQTMPRPPDLDQVRVRVGPLFVNPTLSLTGGIDTNVFNEADSVTAQEDLTFTMTPTADLWLRMGRTWIIGNLKEDLVWYKTFDDQRSINGSYTGDWLVPLNRLTVAVGGNWISTNDRPGLEIDTRADRSERAAHAIVEIRALSKTFFGVRGERRQVEFAEGEAFLGADLSTELNRTVTTGAVTVRNALTPLTSVAFAVGRQQERFDLSPVRDSDSTRFDASLSFDPFALISGSATIGFRDFKPLSADVPGYRGATAAVNLSYTVLGSTRLAVGLNRDVEYSSDVEQPYYLLTGFNTSLAQQVYGPLDVQLRVGTGRLAYTNRERAQVASTVRVDRVRTFGGGVGYRLGPVLRVGVNIDKFRRRSELDSRRYEGLRYGFSVTYGT